jgi:chitodextrinase
MLKHTIQGTTPVSDYEYVVVLNGTDVDTIGVIIGLDGSVEKASPAPSIAITAGDVLTLRLRRTTGAAVTVDWPYIKVVLAQTPALAFTFDNGIAEGGYYFERTA